MKQGIVSIKVMMIISLMLLVHLSYAKETVSSYSTEENTEKTTSLNTSKDLKKNPNQSTLNNNNDIGISNYLQMLLGLFFIIAFIFFVSWMIKRMGTLSPGYSNKLKIIAGLNVGQKEKIIVLQVMDEQLLVGVTQSNIQLLSKLDNPIPIKNVSSAGGFQDKFQAALSGFINKNTHSGKDT